ncbi:hypothetical protein [Kineococcus vitellinus]|uniref:hypothetical protein n=1 Tax=Kineococcus vitellinus TaxID=2696565 RepID=UPI0030B83D81
MTPALAAGAGPLVALLTACALHAGFQAVVSAVVYPALAEVGPERWGAAHGAHSHRIVLLVAPLYAGLVAVWGWVALTQRLDAALVVAAAGTALAGATTALVAAPLHARLGREGPSAALLTRLLRADRVRTLGALLGLAGAVAALVR